MAEVSWVKELAIACRDDNKAQLQNLLAQKKPDDAIDQEIYFREIKHIKYFTHKFTCLILAARFAKPEIFSLLLDAGADLKIGDSAKNASIHHACRSDVKALEKVDLILRKDRSCVNLKGEHDFTPLHWAADVGNN